jgi:hypothetical protein
METISPDFFHKLYGVKKTRIFYAKKDYLDYCVMLLLTAVVGGVAYGLRTPMAIASYVLCATLLVTFTVRYGVEWKVPVILRRPQDVFFLFVYKLQNLRGPYFAALAVLLLETAAVLLTPAWPHYLELTKKVALVLFYAHFFGITAFRTAIFISHLAKREHVREVLMQTPWKRVINDNTSMTLQIVHGYVTGLLTHIILIAPWYLVIRFAKFSVLFLPVVLLLNILIHLRWLKTVNSWFYRDHWVGHNSELEFVYLHGPHHDAIPSGMIAVAGNGFLEGFLRFVIGSPVALYNPIVAFLIFTFDVKTDMELHQYIPGVFPRMPRQMIEVGQHSTHHYGRLEPYGFGLKLDRPDIPEKWKKQYARVPSELMNSFDLDEQLNGFQWNNPTHLLTLRLWDKYQKKRTTAVTTPEAPAPELEPTEKPA